MPSPPTEKRQRVRTKRSRTGCRTCRVRRIKCDETPGACTNCTSTGRSCDYDMHRLPPTHEIPHLTSALARPLAAGFRWKMTSDERRCFSHFQNYTVPGLLELFESPLWQRVVLQMSYSEPAVYHAVVALSAAQQDMEAYGMPLPGETRNSVWQQFALEHSVRSFSLLNKRHASQDPTFRAVMVLCCLLFVLLELLQGQYDRACQHLNSGLLILKELKADRNLVESTSSPIETCVVAAFAQLDNQSAFFPLHGPVFCFDDTIKCHLWLEAHPYAFSSIYEARQTLDPVTSGVYRYLAVCWPLSARGVGLNYHSLHLKQGELLSQLQHYAEAFELFCDSPHSLRNGRETRAADIIRVVYKTLSLAVKVSLLPKHSHIIDLYTPEYATQLQSVEDIMSKFPSRPSISMEPSIVPSLYIIAMGCSDFDIRLRAIEALDGWPHFEGLFDSQWVSLLGVEKMAIDVLSLRYEGGSSEKESDSGQGSEQGSISGEELIRLEERIIQLRDHVTRGHKHSLEEIAASTAYVTAWPCVALIQEMKARYR
ncbi:C6 zinc finger domain protein [Aspergillus heteromorphus CBS 117.55]|uniref:C6 zinc finger domain protein n=1 Tax=Aspergillus heteromorphus CBS 117.55 TaxID=1448321 RepID=A0A317WXE4_9EURO|nr:C6 zinc finger domain protein [Aspergillus heteromorphus CBS 117.55]PWY90685.1 C6 zinc finger domain protein [Aspergillus heteromorphus CBS 117.55]